MLFRAKSPSPSPSPAICPRHGEACRHPGRAVSAHVAATKRVPSAAAVRIRGLARNPAVWFLLLVVAARILTELGWLPPLDWLPGEPRR